MEKGAFGHRTLARSLARSLIIEVDFCEINEAVWTAGRANGGRGRTVGSFEGSCGGGSGPSIQYQLRGAPCVKVK